jgi:hypothetical protein
MYKEYFGLKELPFSIAPDPRYLYMSEQHREALAHLIYAAPGGLGTSHIRNKYTRRVCSPYRGSRNRKDNCLSVPTRPNARKYRCCVYS